MNKYDFSYMMVTYDIIIGILLMLASGKIGSYATVIGPKFGRYTKVSVFTLGSCILGVAGPLYLAFYVFHLQL